MSELKSETAYFMSLQEGENAMVCLKSEVDKVIADLEQKLAAAQQVLRLNEPNALYSNLETMDRLKHEIDVVARRERHHKYKRCLAMAQEWRSLASYYGMRASCCNHRGFGCTAQKYSRREFHAWKCVKQWLAIAKKFKEAQT